MALPFSLTLYQRLTPYLEKGVLAYVRHRIKKGKEDPIRLTERFGQASVPRPSGSVIWFHGASVGEAVSLLPLLERIRREFPHITPLVTTGTVNAARVMTKLMPEGCIHQFIPIDIPAWINAFLDHWQPDIGVFVESEFWPNLILTSQARSIPLYLINATMSEKSYKSWRRFPSVIDHLLSCFELVLAQSKATAKHFKDLGVAPSKVRVFGNLKFAASPLKCDLKELKKLQSTLKGRHIWVAASTHSGEETLVADIHQTIKKSLPNVLTIVIPRHPLRGDDIARELTDKGLEVARRSKGEKIQVSTDIYLVDTIGELGLFYRLSDVAFIGGTFVPIGGHNPIEAVLLDCAVIWGPHTHKQTEICDVLGPAASAVSIKEELASTVQQLLVNETLRNEKIVLGHELVIAQAHILDYVIDALKDKLQLRDKGRSKTYSYK
jgi:3-deoxy-D-manno-octulosonic-acid transferase